LSETLAQEQKLNIIEKEYDIPLENEVRKELDSMCNLSQGIEERATERAEERIILSMYDNGIDIEKIAVVSNRTVNEVREIIDNKQAVLA
jgi:hypothetical protein